ncbi:MAG: cytochrome c [Rubripirellula sp.]
MSNSIPNRCGRLAALFGLPLLLVGCSAESTPEEFEPNLVLAMKYQIANDVDMNQASADSTWVVETMFGTPDDPKLPQVVLDDEDLSQIVSMDNLIRASGPENEAGRGLYRLLCASCHGVTGNGRGPASTAQVPYPRDYRMGIFKFKSTPRGSKPTKADLKQLIKHGINGTNMSSVQDLLKQEKLKRGDAEWLPATITDEDVDALVDYVIYLSFRGEHERQQVDMGIMEEILLDGDRLINSDYGQQIKWADRDTRDAWREHATSMGDKDEDSLTETEAEDLALIERFDEDWGYADEYAEDIADSWLSADDEVLEVPDPPADIPVAENFADVKKFRNGDQAEAFDASVKRGQELFVGKNASCSKCHGEKGLGNGQTTDFDAWTKDWPPRVGLKPDDFDALVPLLARGAMPPQNAMPRNFAEGVFRGGSSSKDLYLRLTQGIDGSPMPAITFVSGQIENDDVWHLINFVRSLQTEEEADAPAMTSEPAEKAEEEPSEESA